MSDSFAEPTVLHLPRRVYTGPRFTYQADMPDWKRQSARRMRKNPTPAEDALWQALRGRRVPRWHRQQPMFGYIADFWCARARLVVEVDGSSHVGRAAEDRKRDKALARHGVRTLRFANEEVLADVAGVLASIEEAIAGSTKPSPVFRDWKL